MRTNANSAGSADRGGFRREARRLLYSVAAGISEAGADERVAQMRFALRPRDGHVKEPLIKARRQGGL